MSVCHRQMLRRSQHAATATLRDDVAATMAGATPAMLSRRPTTATAARAAQGCCSGDATTTNRGCSGDAATTVEAAPVMLRRRLGLLRQCYDSFAMPRAGVERPPELS